jgi:NADH:ubiquinone oxidoreductase subunit 5 (subunit L)/multisubunit Na+/H+ antiporter MnhA subunit
LISAAFLIPLLPLLAFAITIFFGRRLRGNSAAAPAITAAAISSGISFAMLFYVISGRGVESLPW